MVEKNLFQKFSIVMLAQSQSLSIPLSCSTCTQAHMCRMLDENFSAYYFKSCYNELNKKLDQTKIYCCTAIAGEVNNSLKCAEFYLEKLGCGGKRMYTPTSLDYTPF